MYVTTAAPSAKANQAELQEMEASLRTLLQDAPRSHICFARGTRENPISRETIVYAVPETVRVSIEKNWVRSDVVELSVTGYTRDQKDAEALEGRLKAVFGAKAAIESREVSYVLTTNPQKST